MKSSAGHDTLLDRVWSAHEIHRADDGRSLLWVDRHFVHEGSFHAFDALSARGGAVSRADLTFAVADHYVPVRDRPGVDDPAIVAIIERLQANARSHGIRCLGPGDPRQGIVHVVGPELGLTLPGLLLVCGDSHTATHGAFGSIAFGIGASEVAHALATQTLWQRKPQRMRIRFEGELPFGVSAKDLALGWISRLGVDAGRGHAIEYAGSAVRALSMEGRMTLCNLSIEGGARFGLVSPDETTFAYLADRPFAPRGAAFERACADWAALATDADACFDRDVVFDAADFAPMVTWGVSPDDALPIDQRVPDPAGIDDPAARMRLVEALEYMALRPGQSLTEISVDRVFIGSCTNARLDDLCAAAAVLRGRRATVPGLVSPGSSAVKRAAEALGLDRIFRDAGLEWAGSGCSLCVAMNGDRLAPGERCASTTNRNFRGRQGPGSRTHLMSPAMVAAAAVCGHLVDVRELPIDAELLAGAGS